jgi:hypothetical protein
MDFNWPSQKLAENEGPDQSSSSAELGISSAGWSLSDPPSALVARRLVARLCSGAGSAVPALRGTRLIRPHLLSRR